MNALCHFRSVFCLVYNYDVWIEVFFRFQIIYRLRSTALLGMENSCHTGGFWRQRYQIQNANYSIKTAIDTYSNHSQLQSIRFSCCFNEKSTFFPIHTVKLILLTSWINL